MDKESLRKLALDWGADFFGVADLGPFAGSATRPADLLDPYARAVSLGVSLSREVLEGLADGPTPLYSYHYTAANTLLDQVAFRLSAALQSQGHRALPLPASQLVDRDQWRGAISHKAVARMAGLGWLGKSLLLVNPAVGPRLRLVTVLTDLKLPADQPRPNGCGTCEECVQACPAGAIKGTPFGHGYASRAAAWDLTRCLDKLVNDFSQRPGVTPYICGLCIKACPVGRQPGKGQKAG